MSDSSAAGGTTVTEVDKIRQRSWTGRHVYLPSYSTTESLLDSLMVASSPSTDAISVSLPLMLAVSLPLILALSLPLILAVSFFGPPI